MRTIFSISPWTEGALAHRSSFCRAFSASRSLLGLPRAALRAETGPFACPSRLLKNVLHFSYKRWVFEKTELEKQGEFWHPENGTGYGLEGGFFGSSWLCSLQQSHLDPPTQVRSVLYPFSRFFYSPLRLQTLRTLVFQQSARLSLRGLGTGSPRRRALKARKIGLTAPPCKDVWFWHAIG